MPRSIRRWPSIAVVALALLAIASPTALAQPGTGHWEFNLHAAAMRPGLFDDSGQAWQVGSRLSRNFGSGVVLGGSFDFVRTPDVTLAPVAGLGATLLLYGAELGYQAYLSPRSVFLLSGGVGAATVRIEDPPAGVTPSSTGLLVPFGMGIKIHNRAVSPSWGFRFDLRDNVILLEEAGTDGSVANEPRHNPELSVGFSFLFGRGEVEPAARDTDRDGVPDRVDQCLNRPGRAVDARGCPLEPEAPPDVGPDAAPAPDEDGDGVPDSEDGCAGTGEGTPVRDDGCPIPPPDPAAAPSDSDGDGVPDARDECPGTRAAGLEIDERGCLARADEPAAEAEAIEPAPEPQAIEPAPEPEARREPPAADPGPPEAGPLAGGCLDAEGVTIEFDGRTFRPLGFPQEVDRRFLIQAGTYEGLPLLVSDSAEPPYGDLWVPRCGDEGLFELYVERAARP